MKKPGLDLLRAIAIVWVMLFHSYIVGGLGADYAWLSRYGWMGVDLFFVLSGFLIGTQVLASLAQGTDFSFRDFYLRRAFRILPAFWVVLVLYVWLPGLREAPDMEPWWKFATFTVNLSIDYPRNAAFSHAWSLCVEEHFYLLFPLLAWWMVRTPSTSRVMVACLLVLVAGIALRGGIWLHNTALVEAGTPPQRNWFIEDIYYPTWTRLDSILAGVMLAVWKVFRPSSWAWSQRHGQWFLFAGLAVMALSFWLCRERSGLLANTIGWPVIALGLALLVVAGASERSWIGRWPLPGAGWLAAASYSLYLTHKAVFHITGDLLGDSRWGDATSGHPWLTFAVFVMTTLSAGALLHYLVERPGLQLRDRWWRRARAAPGVAADAG